MKSIRLFFAIILFSVANFQGVSQTVYEWDQDGIVIFQFHPELNISLSMLDEQYVDINSCVFLLPYIDEFGITSMKRLHPDIKDEKLLHTYRIDFNEIFKIQDLIAIMSQFDEVEYAEPLPLHKHVFTPNDQYYNSTNQWGLFKINAAQAWDISQGSSSIIVAVTDDAIYTSHPDLTNKMVPGRDVAMNDNNPNPSGQADGNHGTHVSGIVGAQTNNSTGVASIGFNTSVMPIKIARDTDGALTAGYEGITWAADNGAHVINMSWGGGSAGTYGQNVINYAYGEGCIIVAAAGNDDAETMFYPAAYNNVIAVASTGTTDAKSSFSQYGTWITVSSPGSNIASTVPNTGYSYMSGTSMASPMVAGLVGLMLSVNPLLPQADVINCLTSTCDNINAANPSYIGKLGAGRINAYAALQCMQATAVNLDAGITSIQYPAGTICNVTTIAPVVILKNFGMQNLTSVTIRYQLDAGAIQTYSWTGNLTFGQTVTVTLPSVTLSSGGHVFRAYTENPNSGTDENAANDETQTSFTLFSAGLPLPFTEDFESNSFDTNNWTIVNPDGATTWTIATVAGTTPGNKAAKMDFFNYSNTGRRDAMITPPFNLTMYADATLTFKHAYKRRGSSSTDSLIVYVSTNCGSTWQRVLALGENGTGIFATGYTSTSAFTPASVDDWCSGPVGSACKSIDLTPFMGYENVVIKFESFNNNGNNLYIDNINITGSPLTTAPTVQFNSTVTSICEGGTITFTDQSSPVVTSRVWTFEDGAPGSSTSAVQNVMYNNAGTWDVNLEATNGFGTSSQNFPDYITVYPPPPTQTIQENGNILSVTLSAGQSVQWYRNGNMISGATSPTYQVTQIGNFKARITSEHGCHVFTNEVYVNPTSMEEYEFDMNSLFVFPNPASDEVYVFLETMVVNNTDFEISDITGKIVASYVIPAGDQKLMINVSNLAQGSYLVHLRGNSYSNTVRLLIVR